MSTITKNVLWSLILCYSISWIQFAQAKEEFLCDATQASTQELPLLDKTCPIGRGLWGKALPRKTDSTFWIQCGIYHKPIPLKQAKILYQNISTDVWMKPEAANYRCLIGPYDQINAARQDLKKVRTLRPYKQAFIREVFKQGRTTPSTASSPTPQRKPKPVKPTPVKTAPVAVPKPTKPVTEPKRVASQTFSGVEVRKRTTIANVNYAIPFAGTSNGAQFYMEYNKPWNRLSYDDSRQMCQKIGMKLATEQQWQRLRLSKIMEKEKWPLYLPYWGESKKGLFASGKVTQLKGTSLLNVLCVK